MSKISETSNIISPVRAEDTGLIPNGWSVFADLPEGRINLDKLDYSFCPAKHNDAGYECCYFGDYIIRAAEKKKAYGSLGFGAALLKLQDEGKEIFPVESRGKHCFYLPRTVLLDRISQRIAYFWWSGKLKRWKLGFNWVGVQNLGCVRFICPMRKNYSAEVVAKPHGL